jgi:hypothetical protein
MQNINSAEELKAAIESLKAEQILKGRLLKEQLNYTFDSLKPVNILKNALNDISSAPEFTENILGTATGLASGYLSKRIFTGSSRGTFRNLLGTLLQVGVTNLVAKHPDAIKTLGKFISDFFKGKKEKKSKKRKN